MAFTTADFFRIENGRIVEHWDVVDTLARAVGLGLVSPPK
jgi:predicted SnoaL-like aldol condensation-catalyzing enzyme